MILSHEIPQVDVLAIGAHPDDVELGVGGIVANYVRAGYRVGILDLTRGELGTRGTKETRADEADEAARILGVCHRGNAALPDGAIANTTVQQHVVIPWLRLYRPKIVLCPMDRDRHPDHRRTYALIRDANFFAGLAKIVSTGKPYRVPHIYYYAPYSEDVSDPAMVIDISGTFETKLKALRAYVSQFYSESTTGAATFISTPEFWDGITLRAQYWGRRIGAAYGEPLATEGPIGLALPPGLENRE